MISEISVEVGISRRTFFNYFASKDDAVVGIPLERFDTEAAQAFVAGAGTAVSPSRTLLADLAVLTLARWRFFDLAPQSIPSLRQAVQREPRLLARMVRFGQQNEALDISLIQAREGMSPGDPRATVAAHLVGSIARDFLAPENSESYSTVFARWVAETGNLLATQDAIQTPREPERATLRDRPGSIEFAPSPQRSHLVMSAHSSRHVSGLLWCIVFRVA